MKRLTISRGSSTARLFFWGGLVALALLAFYIPNYYAAFRVFQFTLVLVLAVAVLGLNLLTGYNGQISLGHSFFFAIGAYLGAVLIQDYGWNYWLTLPLAFALNFVLGYLFGIPALRLEGLYLALVTLALAVVTPPLIKRFDDVTGGSQGINVASPDAPEWTGLAGDQWLYFVALIVAVVFFLIARNLVTGRVGRAMLAVRDNELAAETLGINLAAYKTMTFAYSAGFAGVAGGVYTLVVGFVSPESFTVLLAIAFLSAMVVGGLATVTGAIFGALFIQFVPTWAADVNDAVAGVIYGAALILVMFVMPGGAVGLLRRIRDLVVRVEPRRLPPASPTPDHQLVAEPVDAGTRSTAAVAVPDAETARLEEERR